MTALIFDAAGDRLYETGVSHGVLYVRDAFGVYGEGVAWNGLTAVNHSPSGAEPTKLYADNIAYITLLSAEEFGATIEAYSSPVEFDQCDGSAGPVSGVSFGQQARRTFGFSHRTLIGSDLDPRLGYKIHLIWGALAAPSERAYATVNDSPEAATLSWEITTTQVTAGADFQPTASASIDSTLVDADALKELEDILYGTAGTEPRLPSPEEVIEIFNGTVSVISPAKPTQVGNVVTIPSVTGARYRVAGVVRAAGTVTITDDTIVSVEALPGYKFPPAYDNDWLFEHS